MEYSQENISNNDYMKSLLRQIHKLTINNAKLEIENDELKKQLKLYDVGAPKRTLPCNKCDNGIIWEEDHLSGTSCTCN